jgi:CheY-like chemotaxis protein
MDVAGSVGSIEADARKVKQIAYNLLSNAVKFSNAGGHVHLCARRVSREAVGRLDGVRAGRTLPMGDNDFTEFIEISVADSGIGISPDGLARLFSPFSQIDSGLARKYEGTGLGLALVKTLSELHGGAIAVESTVGIGSRFFVWLPCRQVLGKPAPAPVLKDGPVKQVMPGAQVALVVEGDFKSAELIRVQLEAEGFVVVHAASAEVALAIAVQQPLSLITLDIMLPNMDGWEFLSRIKQMPALQRTPVVIISVVADRNRGFALGAAAVVETPITRQALYDALADLGVVPVPHGQTLKVLVVDDDPMAVELAAVRVVGLAGTVLRAYGGQNAIDLARTEIPDVIVLDLMMPDVNGFDVVEALKEHPGTSRIPILVVTAKRLTADDRARLTGSVATIMEKTEFEGERFTTEVRRAMSGRYVGA